MTGSTIRELAVERLDLALREPFGIASGAQEVARNVLVTATLEDGTRGYGEAAPFPIYNGETQEGAEAAIAHAHDAVIGLDARHWRRIAATLSEATSVGAARCAIETAVLDAMTRQAGLPLWMFFGGASQALESDITIPTGSVEQARSAAASARAQAYRSIKIKVGGAAMTHDVDRILAAHASAPECAILLDANASLDADAALGLLGALARGGVRPRLFEQPTPRDDWDGLRIVAEKSGTAVAADESACNAADVMAIARERAAQVINVKPMKSGLVEALRMVEVARGAGLGLMIGGMVETVLAMTASASLAAGVGGFDFVDLDTPLFFAEVPFRGRFPSFGPRVDLSMVDAGHGCLPARDPRGRASAIGT